MKIFNLLKFGYVCLFANLKITQLVIVYVPVELANIINIILKSITNAIYTYKAINFKACLLK